MYLGILQNGVFLTRIAQFKVKLSINIAFVFIKLSQDGVWVGSRIVDIDIKSFTWKPDQVPFVVDLFEDQNFL